MSTTRKVGVLAATLGLTSAVLLGTATSSSAYGQCTETVPADHHSVSVFCPARSGVTTQFRVKTYSCKNANGTSCSTTPIYGNYANWGGTSSVSANPYCIDVNDIEVDSGITVQ